jgi:hypothetical protein
MRSPTGFFADLKIDGAWAAFSREPSAGNGDILQCLAPHARRAHKSGRVTRIAMAW